MTSKDGEVGVILGPVEGAQAEKKDVGSTLGESAGVMVGEGGGCKVWFTAWRIALGDVRWGSVAIRRFYKHPDQY
jgi:hypothetical protein